MTERPVAGSWVLLVYRLPREPSRPRIAVWRKLERFGVARLGDGVVGLPADARTREQFDWIADEIIEAGGSCTVWLSAPASAAQERDIAAGMRAARAAEYQAVTAEAGAVGTASDADRVRARRRLREELRRIARRDFFPPPERAAARAAVRALGDDMPATDNDPAPLRSGRPGAVAPRRDRPRGPAARPVSGMTARTGRHPAAPAGGLAGEGPKGLPEEGTA